MPKLRNIVGAFRAVAVWLLVVSVFFGPAALGGPVDVASAAVPCGVDCPCSAALADGADAGAGPASAESSPHADTEDSGCEHDGQPCQEGCPDDCQDCHSSRGVAMAVLALPVPHCAPWYTSCPPVLEPVDAPASGPSGHVFRPPRSLI